MKKKIILHPHMDLDACACAWAAGADEVHFLPAHVRDLPAICPCCEQALDPTEVVILDHPVGEKGHLDSDGKRRAALCSLPEAKRIDPALLAEVDEQDSTGTIQAPRFSLGELLSGLRQEAIERGLHGRDCDLDLLETTRRIFQGIQIRYESKQKADWWIKNHIQIHEIGTFRFASCSKDLPPTVGEVLNEQGVSGFVYGGTEVVRKEEKVRDWNIGVFRFPGREAPDLKLLSPRLPGWFCHPAGFLVAWGTRKAPASSPPPNGTPRSQGELIALMREMLCA